MKSSIAKPLATRKLLLKVTLNLTFVSLTKLGSAIIRVSQFSELFRLAIVSQVAPLSAEAIMLAEFPYIAKSPQ